MTQSKIDGATALVMIMVGALFTWALYRFLYVAAGDVLMSIGVVNDYWQNGVIVLVTGAILYFVGKKSLKNYIK